MTRLLYLIISILGGFIFCFWVVTKKPQCVFKVKQRITIATIECRPFSEYIPVTGILLWDTIRNISIVRVTIDELYLPKILPAMEATTRVNDTIYTLEVATINPAVIAGRFTVDMNFKNDVPSKMVKANSLRLRIELSEPIDALLIPVGGFYKDTEGKWVFLVENEDRAVRRDVKLGRKNSDYYEILEGLKPGDRVITSPYDAFEKEEILDLVELRKFFL